MSKIGPWRPGEAPGVYPTHLHGSVHFCGDSSSKSPGAGFFNGLGSVFIPEVVTVTEATPESYASPGVSSTQPHRQSWGKEYTKGKLRSFS